MTKRSLFPLSIRLSCLVTIVAITIGIIGAAYLRYHETKTSVSIPVPKQDLPAYHPIRPSDLVQKTYATRNLPSNTFRKPQEITGRYALTQIPKQKPLTEKQLSTKVDIARLADTVAVGIPATPATTLGGSLQPGDTVDIMLIPATVKAGSSPSPIVFPNILVLDIKPASQANASSTAVVVIALPVKRQNEFAVHSQRGTLLFSRQL
jgi:Flp pilus assembly protein CpaB